MWNSPPAAARPADCARPVAQLVGALRRSLRQDRERLGTAPSIVSSWGTALA